MTTTLVALVLLCLMTGTAMAQQAKVTSLMSKDLAENPGREVLMITVEHAPGGSDPIHRHNAHAIVYVLEGSIVMQVKREGTLDRESTLTSCWAKLQRDIATCRKCLDKWPEEVIRPLSVGEIPDPPGEVKLLFVGVAPTPNQGKNKGGHFYSTANDPLRVQLFEMLDTLIEPKPNLSQRNTSSKADGNDAFHGLGLFFVHAAKVRPIRKKPAPGRPVMRFCFEQHLAHEIQTLKPPVVCFLGAINATPAAVALFGQRARTGPVADAVLGSTWQGKVVVSSQPLRAGKAAAPAFLREALKEAGYSVRQPTT